VGAALAVEVVAWAGEPGAWRRALAAEAGAIRSLVTARIAPAAYCHERAVCIDTTAAGGNATLLAQTS
jgi:RHH-type proline utilization regulon transcriptional repressor/proline dehydrogenase/delta 1-pyrroline-5-carboxylate dehydrogenase